MTQRERPAGRAGETTGARPAERRSYVKSLEPSSRELVEQSLYSAARQLHDAREALKVARRRVVQLEDVVAYWQELNVAVTSDRRADAVAR